MTVRENVMTPVMTDLLLYITDRCNLRCRHCYYVPESTDGRGSMDGELSVEQICNVIDELLPFGLRSCKISGGEPFVRPDVIDVCRHLDDKGLRVVIETNGTLITDEEIDALASLRGTPFIAVSLDGACAETHDRVRGVPGSFEKAMRTVEKLVKKGIPNQVIAALFPENKDELRELAKLCAAKGVHSFKLQPIKPVGRGGAIERLDPEEIIALDREFSLLAKGLGLRYGGSIPMALVDIETMLTNNMFGGRCNVCSTLGILGDGTLTICGMGRLLEDFRFGKVGEVSVAEVWQTNPVLARVRESIPKELDGICGRCIFRSQCLGGCRLFAEDSDADSLCSPYWLCAEMERRGLFLETRIVDRSTEKDVACLSGD